jgi:hypothetical protein
MNESQLFPLAKFRIKQLDNPPIDAKWIKADSHDFWTPFPRNYDDCGQEMILLVLLPITVVFLHHTPIL